MTRQERVNEWPNSLNVWWWWYTRHRLTRVTTMKLHACKLKAWLRTRFKTDESVNVLSQGHQDIVPEACSWACVTSKTNLLAGISKSKPRYDWRSVSQSWCRALCGGSWLDFSHILDLYDLCGRGVPSLTKGRVSTLSRSLRSLLYIFTYTKLLTIIIYNICSIYNACQSRRCADSAHLYLLETLITRQDKIWEGLN
jgi:hypothetical protein